MQTLPIAPLAVAAVLAEQKRHASRLAEIKKLAVQMALLDVFVPALHAAGIELDVRDIKSAFDMGTGLRLRTPLFDERFGYRVAQVLLAQGMREKRRIELSCDDYGLTLTKGRLNVTFVVNARGKAAVLAQQQEGAPCKPCK